MAIISKRKSLAAAALFFVLCLGSSASADNTVGGKAQELLGEGLAQYQAGKFHEAAATFRKAYELEPTPRLAFNVARAYEKDGAFSQALTFYELYVYSPKTEPDVLAKALEGIERIKLRLNAPVSKPVPETQASATKPERPEEEGPSHVPAYLLMGGGVAVFAVGGGVALWANGTASDAERSRDPIERPQLRDAAYGRAIAADITMGVGAALAVVGLVLRLTAPKTPKAVTTSLAVVSSGATWRF